jgi:hypothetical protein
MGGISPDTSVFGGDGGGERERRFLKNRPAGGESFGPSLEFDGVRTQVGVGRDGTELAHGLELPERLHVGDGNQEPLSPVGREAPEACVTNVENLGFDRRVDTGDRRQGQHARRHPLVPRTARTIDLAVGRQETEASPVVGARSARTRGG